MDTVLSKIPEDSFGLARTTTGSPNEAGLACLCALASWEGEEGAPHVVQPRAISSLLHAALQCSEHVGGLAGSAVQWLTWTPKDLMLRQFS